MPSPSQSQESSTLFSMGQPSHTRQESLLHDAEMSHHSVTILRDSETVYNFFRDFQNLPLFMKDIAEIQVISPKVSRWIVKLSHGPSIEWDAEIIAERPNEMISWKSIGESEVKQAGSVWFTKAPGERGTVVRLSMKYIVPGGRWIELISHLLGENSDTLIKINLRRLKAYLETGEIPTIEGQPSGRDEDATFVANH